MLLNTTPTLHEKSSEAILPFVVHNAQVIARIGECDLLQQQCARFWNKRHVVAHLPHDDALVFDLRKVLENRELWQITDRIGEIESKMSKRKSLVSVRKEKAH